MAGVAGETGRGSWCERRVSGHCAPRQVPGGRRAGHRQDHRIATGPGRCVVTYETLDFDARRLRRDRGIPEGSPNSKSNIERRAMTYRPSPGQLPEREAIPVSYTWDLSHICQSWDEW